MRDALFMDGLEAMHISKEEFCAPISCKNESGSVY